MSASACKSACTQPFRMLFTGIALLICAPHGRAQRLEVRDRYQLQARLDPQRHAVHGRATIDWVNRSDKPVTALFFHLYPNAFANERTVFMREQGQRLRGTRLQRTGGIDVLSLRTADGSDLLAHGSTNLVKDDATQMRVELATPLQPGQSLRLEAVFVLHLPSIVARMGASGDFFMVAQWFPKLARLEPDGTWASFPYHGLGEFYADFADYELELRVPKGYVAAAPGKLTSRAETDGSVVERYSLSDALDVAWAASPSFTRVDVEAGRVRVEAFAPAGHIGLARREAELVRELLPVLERRFGPYPHDRLVVVLPTGDASGAAGMEYPGLIVGWSTSWQTEWNPALLVMHDVVVSHELAHQWFPMLVASHELETPMMDEGLAEWLALDLLRRRYDASFFWHATGLRFDLFELEHASFTAANLQASSLLPAYRYSAAQLAPAVYLRPSLALESIRRSWGAARLDSVLGNYARRYRMQHPGPAQLWAAFDQGYFPGFSERVLRPTLEGQPFRPPLQADAYRQDLVDPATPEVHRTTDSVGLPLLARLLLLAQALLAVLGP